MRKYLIIIFLSVCFGEVMASESYPLVIRKYKEVRHKQEKILEQVFRYDTDTNLVEQKEYQILDLFDKNSWSYKEGKYITFHKISEYNETGCYHSIEYSRAELNPNADDPFEYADTTFCREEYFFSYLEGGKSQTICITDEDSIVEIYDSHCRLQNSQTFCRANGLLYEKIVVEWSADSLEAKYARYVYSKIKHIREMAPNKCGVHRSHELYNEEGDRTLFEDENTRQTIRYWYRSNGEIRKSYMRNYKLRNGKWKCTDYSWIHAHYRHGYTEVEGLKVGAALSVRDKYNNQGDLIFTREVFGVACLIPFTNKFVYEYEYLDKP